MGCRLDLIPSELGAGFATLKITGWRAAGLPEQFSVARNSDHYYLNPDGSWTPQESWLTVTNPRQAAGQVEADLEPSLVDSLVGATNLRYLVELKGAGTAERSVMNIDPQVVTSSAYKQASPTPAETPKPVNSPAPEASAPPPETDEDVTAVMPKTEPEEDTPAPEIVKPDTPAPASKSKAWLAVAALLLIVAIGLSWWWLNQDDTSASDELVDTATEAEQVPGSEDDTQQASAEGTDEPVAQVSEPDTQQATAAPCVLSQASEQSDLAFLQTCLASDPDQQQIKQLLTDAEQQQRCDLAHRLYVYQSRSDAVIARQFASRHDPSYFKSGGCVQNADLETAGYWYRRALELDTGNAELKRELGKTLTQLHSSGREYDEGLQLLKDAAEAGDNQAQQLLAEISG